MEAGFACSTITPPLGTRMLGFMNRDAERGCVRIHDDLSARALYLEHEGEQALVVGLDLCFLSRGVSDRIKGALGNVLGLAPRQILLNCSHTHNGPATSDWGVGTVEATEEFYIEYLERRILEAAQHAAEQCRPCRLEAGEGCSSIPMSRRLWQQGVGIVNAPNASGVVYDRLPVWTLRGDVDGDLICLVFSVSAHPSAMASHAISAEYPGRARACLEEELGQGRTLFLQGAAGDLKTIFGRRDPSHWAWWTDDPAEYLDKTGRRLADEVVTTCRRGLAPVPDGLACGLHEMRLPLMPGPAQDDLDEQARADYPDAASFEDRFPRHWAERQRKRLATFGSLDTHALVLMQQIRVGPDLRIVAVEGEPVAELGWLIHGAYNSGVTFVLGYSNGDALYLPCDRMLVEGGYEVDSFREYGYPAKLAGGIDATVRNTVARLQQNIRQARVVQTA